VPDFARELTPERWAASSAPRPLWQLVGRRLQGDAAIERAIVAASLPTSPAHAFQLAQPSATSITNTRSSAEEHREKKVFLLWLTGYLAGNSSARWPCWA